MKIRLQLPKNPSPTVAIVFAVPGVLCLAMSVVAESQVLAFIGLGLTFWGAVFLFARPTLYVKSSLLDATAFSSYRTVDRIIEDLKIRGKAFYIPSYPREVYLPEHLKGLKDTLVFISAKATATPPTTLEIASSKFVVKNADGIFIAPPGLSLLEMCEKEMRTDFAKTSIENLCESLPQLILENFQLAREMEMKAEKGQVTLRMEDSVFKNLYCESNLKSAQTLGCPLASAVACAIAKTSGKTVTVDSIRTSLDAETVEVKYTFTEG